MVFYPRMPLKIEAPNKLKYVYGSDLHTSLLKYGRNQYSMLVDLTSAVSVDSVEVLLEAL